MAEWLCESCCDDLDGDHEIKLLPNVFKQLCIYCGKIAKYLVVLTKGEINDKKTRGKERN